MKLALIVSLLMTSLALNANTIQGRVVRVADGDTINDDKTVAGGGKKMILAGCYHILHPLGHGGMGEVW